MPRCRGSACGREAGAGVHHTFRRIRRGDTRRSLTGRPHPGDGKQIRRFTDRPQLHRPDEHLAPQRVQPAHSPAPSPRRRPYLKLRRDRRLHPGKRCEQGLAVQLRMVCGQRQADRRGRRAAIHGRELPSGRGLQNQTALHRKHRRPRPPALPCLLPDKERMPDCRHQGGQQREWQPCGFFAHGCHCQQRLGGGGFVPQGRHRALLLARGADNRRLHLHPARTEGKELCHHHPCRRSGSDADRRAEQRRTERPEAGRPRCRRAEEPALPRRSGRQPD